MAEGGDEFGYDNPILENDNDDSDFSLTIEDINAVSSMIPETEEKLSVTAPFVPSGSSTPYHGGEAFEMPSYDERTHLIEKNSFEDIVRRLDNLRNTNTGMLRTDVPAAPKLIDFIDKDDEIGKVKKFIKDRFPNAKVDNMKLQFSTNPKKPLETVIKGPKGGETNVLLDDGSGFQKKFRDATFIKKSLGESYEELRSKEAQFIYGETQKLLKDKIHLKDAEAEKKKQNDVDSTRQETERIRSEFISRQEEIIRRGGSIGKEEEIRQLKEAKKELKLLQEMDKKKKKK